MEKNLLIEGGCTLSIQDKLERCESIDDLRLILEKNSRYFINWKAHINYLVNTSGYSYRKFASKCGISHNTIKSWCEKGLLPRSRNQFIQIGFGLKMSLATLNDFLQRYGKYPQLYSKNIEDAIFIFALNQGMDFSTAIALQDRFHYIIEAVFDKTLNNQTSISYYETLRLQTQLLSLHGEMQFEEFVKENIVSFSTSYEKLISYIDDYFDVATYDFMGADQHESLNSFLHTNIHSPQTINHLNKMISRLKTYRVIPKRNDLIALGIYLDMPLDDVNQLLSMAGMGPLCAKDKIESIVIYAIETAILNNPDIEYSNALLLKNFSENPEVIENCRRIIDRYEMNPYTTLEEDGGILKYVREALEQFDLEDVSELSRLLQ